MSTASGLDERRFGPALVPFRRRGGADLRHHLVDDEHEPLGSRRAWIAKVEQTG